MEKIKKKRNQVSALKLSLKIAKEYFEYLCKIRKKYTVDEITESKDFLIVHRALWVALIIEISRLFDTYETKSKKVISLKKTDFSKINTSAKKIIDNIHGEAIIGKIINTRKTFTAHLGEEEEKVVSVTEICNSKLGELLNKLDKLF